MKKRILILAMTSAFLGSAVPMTSYAADVKVIKQGNGYAVFSGQCTDNIQQTLETIFSNLKDSNVTCPDIPGTGSPEQPGTQNPVTPSQPDIQEPAAPSQPDIQEPITPSQPDTQEPVAPSQPDIQEPVTPSQPNTQEPAAPSQPDTQEPAVPVQPDHETAEDSLVHPYVKQVLDLVNQERINAGLSELKLDAGITAAANIRAKEIKQSFSHTRPNGSSFSTVLTEQGISYRGSGENIAWGQRTPQQVMEGWMNSDGHRANILNKNYTNIGVGFYQKNGVNYWVQLFTY